jgi:RNA polymerase sigma-70 factor, ECF subfamily
VVSAPELVEWDDATVVARVGDGDVRAFEQLVVRYQSPMYRLALRMLARSGDAEDVAQDVFVTAWRRLPEVPPEQWAGLQAAFAAPVRDCS